MLHFFDHFIGKVIQNSNIYILGNDLGLISDGHQGELCISGACLAVDYVDPSSMQEEKKTFVKNPIGDTQGHERIFRSAEFGRIIKCKDGKRRMYVEGRGDRMVKARGHEFYVDDLKPFLAELPFAKDAFLYVLNQGFEY